MNNINFSMMETIEDKINSINIAKKNEAILYLQSTDWYVLRKIETGKEIPDDIIKARSNARNTITSFNNTR